MTDFVHLHVHSEYSLLDGACRIDRLLDRAAELGQNAVAITDHGVMYGVIDFYKAAKKKGIKPIVGCEVYVAPRTRFDKTYELDAEAYHLVLLCKNQTGYQNLIKLCSLGFTQGFYIKPRVDMELLRSHSEGLIALSACLAGRIPSEILKDELDKARETAKEFAEIFGEDFYLEIQDHNLPEQKTVNREILKMASEMNLPLVATNDAHYITKDDAYIQDVLLCIQTNRTVDETDRMKFATEEFYIKSGDEMAALFQSAPSAIENTLKIAEKCNLEFEFGKHHLPEFSVPKGYTAFEYLKKLCLEGFENRYPDGKAEYRDRLEFELNMINRMGFVDYFLIVGDFIAFAKSRDIAVGPGRGSAAGSMVSYCLGITNIDPIKYSLYFERFLNPERISMPDIDIDFCYLRRQEVIDYVIEKYGEDRVAQIVTFGTMAARAAIRDVGRALNIAYATVDNVAKQVPFELHMTLKRALEVSPKFKELYESDESIKHLIDTALALEGMPRHASTHAAGVVITKNPIYEYVPLSKNDESIVTQFTMGTLEQLGLLKMDFLGLRTLTVIVDTVSMIRNREPDFEIDRISLEDVPTYQMLSQGKTKGVFQLESAGITNVVTGLQPKSMEDITAVVALYRPGPMASIPTYIECKHHPEKVKYKHPLLESILSVTYGCMIYQEQVMEVFRKLAGYSLGKADMVRRAMSKKKFEELARERQNFIFGNAQENIKGAVANGVDEKIAAEIFDEIMDFANYAFNKAHAASYAVISYQTAYLKCHYPKEFMAALLTSVLDSSTKVAEYIAESKEMGITVLPPDINESAADFSVVSGNIRFGLVAIKNVGRSFILKLIEEREKNGKFQSFQDFCERMYSELNKRMVESLIKSGSFDGFKQKRSQLLMVFEKIMESISLNNRRNLEGQINLFENTGTNEKISMPAINEFSPKELLTMEKETTGLYLSGHPMDDYRFLTKKAGVSYLGDILEDFTQEIGPQHFGDTMMVTVAGVITSFKLKTTKSNSMMAYFTMEDMTGAMELMAFSRVVSSDGAYIKNDNVVIVRGRITAREDEEPKLICEQVRPLTEEEIENFYKPNLNGFSSPAVQKQLYIKIEDENDPRLARAKAIMGFFPGDIPVVLYSVASGRTSKARRDLWVLHDQRLITELSDLFGKDNIIIK